MISAEKVHANQVLAQEQNGYGAGRLLQYHGLRELLPAAAVAGKETRVSEVGDERKAGRSFGVGSCST